MDSKQLLTHFIEPACSLIGLASDEASILLLATAAVESDNGKYVKQIGGPALGWYQMEPATHQDLYDNFLKYKPTLENKLKFLALPGFDRSHQLTVNPLYAAGAARLQYYRVPKPLPEIGVESMWPYYKDHWNSHKGATTYSKWNDAWERFVAPVL